MQNLIATAMWAMFNGAVNSWWRPKAIFVDPEPDPQNFFGNYGYEYWVRYVAQHYQELNYDDFLAKSVLSQWWETVIIDLRLLIQMGYSSVFALDTWAQNSHLFVPTSVSPLRKGSRVWESIAGTTAYRCYSEVLLSLLVNILYTFICVVALTTH